MVVELTGDTLNVESEQLLAISDGLRTDVAFAGLRGASSGQGLFTTTVTGSGAVALAGGRLGSAGYAIANEAVARCVRASTQLAVWVV